MARSAASGSRRPATSPRPSNRAKSTGAAGLGATWRRPGGRRGRRPRRSAPRPQPAWRHRRWARARRGCRRLRPAGRPTAPIQCRHRRPCPRRPSRQDPLGRRCRCHSRCRRRGPGCRRRGPNCRRRGSGCRRPGLARPGWLAGGGPGGPRCPSGPGSPSRRQTGPPFSASRETSGPPSRSGSRRRRAARTGVPSPAVSTRPPYPPVPGFGRHPNRHRVQPRRLRRGVLQRRRQISVGQVRCWRLGQRRDGVGDPARAASVHDGVGGSTAVTSCPWRGVARAGPAARASFRQAARNRAVRNRAVRNGVKTRTACKRRCD